MSGEERKGRDLTPREVELAQALPRLTPEQVAEVSPKLKREAFPPGEVIIHQGDLPDRFYIVIFGHVEIFYEDLENRTHAVDTRKPGLQIVETVHSHGRPGPRSRPRIGGDIGNRHGIADQPFAALKPRIEHLQQAPRGELPVVVVLARDDEHARRVPGLSAVGVRRER